MPVAAGSVLALLSTRDAKEGQRRLQHLPALESINAAADACPGVVINSVNSAGVGLLSDDVILTEVRKRHLAGVIVEDAADDDFVSAARARGIKLLIGAMTQDLIHELRRQNCRNWDHAPVADMLRRGLNPTQVMRLECTSWRRKKT